MSTFKVDYIDGDAVTHTGATPAASIETVTATAAVSPLVDLVYLDSTSGVQANTLADGAVGQKISLVMIADGGDSVLTPASLLNGTTLTFNDVGDSADLIFMSTGWVSMGGTATLA